MARSRNQIKSARIFKKAFSKVSETKKTFWREKSKLFQKVKKVFRSNFGAKQFLLKCRRRRTKSRNQRKGLFLRFCIIEKILSFLNNIWWKTQKQRNTDQPFQAHRYTCSAILIIKACSATLLGQIVYPLLNDTAKPLQIHSIVKLFFPG